MTVVAEVTILVRQSGDGFYLTGSGGVVLFCVLFLLMLIAKGVNRW